MAAWANVLKWSTGRKFSTISGIYSGNKFFLTRAVSLSSTVLSVVLLYASSRFTTSSFTALLPKNLNSIGLISAIITLMGYRGLLHLLQNVLVRHALLLFFSLLYELLLLSQIVLIVCSSLPKFLFLRWL